MAVPRENQEQKRTHKSSSCQRYLFPVTNVSVLAWYDWCAVRNFHDLNQMQQLRKYSYLLPQSAQGCHGFTSTIIASAGFDGRFSRFRSGSITE
jgi:hypothetical protein